MTPQKENEVRKAAVELLGPSVLKNLSTIDCLFVFKSFVKIWLAIVLLIVTSIGIYSISRSLIFFLAPIFSILIASRFHALSVQVHEGSHNLLHANKKINDLITNFLAGYWILYDVELYRSTHFPHHRYLNTVNDPEGYYYQIQNLSKRDLLVLFLKDLSMYTAFERIFLAIRNNDKQDNRIRSRDKLKSSLMLQSFFKMACLVLIAFLFSLTFSFPDSLYFFFILWIYPLFAIFPTLVRIRGTAEHWHSSVSNSEGIFVTTTRPFSKIENLFIGSQMEYHVEHHLFPNVPYKGQRELHKILYNGRFYSTLNEELLSSSYLQTWIKIFKYSSKGAIYVDSTHP